MYLPKLNFKEWSITGRNSNRMYNFYCKLTATVQDDQICTDFNHFKCFLFRIFYVIVDSPAVSRPLSQLSRLSRLSGRARTPLDAVAAANQAENLRLSPTFSSRPQTGKSGRSVVIAEDISDLKAKSKKFRKSTQL